MAQKAHALLRQGGVTCVDCHTNLVHPAAASPATQSSAQQRGGVIYAANCAICHGAEGNGRGQRQASMNPPPANLTLPPWSEPAAGGLSRNSQWRAWDRDAFLAYVE